MLASSLKTLPMREYHTRLTAECLEFITSPFNLGGCRRGVVFIERVIFFYVLRLVSLCLTGAISSLLLFSFLMLFPVFFQFFRSSSRNGDSYEHERRTGNAQVDKNGANDH